MLTFARVTDHLPDPQAVELVWATVGDYRLDPVAMLMLAAWTVAAAAVAVWAYRRDEGRRFG